MVLICIFVYKVGEQNGLNVLFFLFFILFIKPCLQIISAIKHLKNVH